MTRSLGDSLAHQQAGVSSIPEIDYNWLDDGDDFIIVASDGLWDVLDPQSAIDKVQEYIRGWSSRLEPGTSLSVPLHGSKTIVGRTLPADH